MENVTSAALLYANKRYTEAADAYRRALNAPDVGAFIESDLEGRHLMTYMLCECLLNTKVGSDLLEALVLLLELKEEISDVFPAVHCALAEAYVKLYRFPLAKYEIDQGFILLINGTRFKKYLVPMSYTGIKESTKIGFLSTLLQLNNDCASLDRPQAVCNMTECKNSMPPGYCENRSIYYSDPFFKGMVTVMCTNKPPCILHYHNICWIYMRRSFCATNDTDLLNIRCFTPNCEKNGDPNTIQTIKITNRNGGSERVFISSIGYNTRGVVYNNISESALTKYLHELYNVTTTPKRDPTITTLDLPDDQEKIEREQTEKKIIISVLSREICRLYGEIISEKNGYSLKEANHASKVPKNSVKTYNKEDILVNLLFDVIYEFILTHKTKAVGISDLSKTLNEIKATFPDIFSVLKKDIDLSDLLTYYPNVKIINDMYVANCESQILLKPDSVASNEMELAESLDTAIKCDITLNADMYEFLQERNRQLTFESEDEKSEYSVYYPEKSRENGYKDTLDAYATLIPTIGNPNQTKFKTDVQFNEERRDTFKQIWSVHSSSPMSIAEREVDDVPIISQFLGTGSPIDPIKNNLEECKDIKEYLTEYKADVKKLMLKFQCVIENDQKNDSMRQELLSYRTELDLRAKDLEHTKEMLFNLKNRIYQRRSKGQNNRNKALIAISCYGMDKDEMYCKQMLNKSQKASNNDEEIYSRMKIFVDALPEIIYMGNVIFPSFIPSDDLKRNFLAYIYSIFLTNHNTLAEKWRQVLSSVCALMNENSLHVIISTEYDVVQKYDSSEVSKTDVTFAENCDDNKEDLSACEMNKNIDVIDSKSHSDTGTMLKEMNEIGIINSNDNQKTIKEKNDETTRDANKKNNEIVTSMMNEKTDKLPTHQMHSFDKLMYFARKRHIGALDHDLLESIWEVNMLHGYSLSGLTMKTIMDGVDKCVSKRYRKHLCFKL